MYKGNKNHVESINYLITNFFLYHPIEYKLYVCHYIFCSYALTKNPFYFEFAIDALQDTLRFAYLNRKRERTNFHRVLEYCIFISIILEIELEIDDLISDEPDIQFSGRIYQMIEENLMEFDNSVMGRNWVKKNTSIKVLLQVRKGIINKKNYSFYIKSLGERFDSNTSNEYLNSLILIAYLFQENDTLNFLLQKFYHKRQRDINIQIINIIKGHYENNSPLITPDINSVIENIDIDLRIDLGVIYYFLIYEKAKCYLNQFQNN